MADLSNNRILIVDDNEAIHTDFRQILTPAARSAELDDLEDDLFGERQPSAAAASAFVIDSAFQGLEAIELVRRAVAAGRPYAMAFVDVRMPPGIDGIETAARIWAIDANLQIVICTAHSDYSWEQTVVKLGHLERWLVQKKPFDQIEVRQAAHALTEKWKLLRLSQALVADLEAKVAERTQALVEANAQLKQEMLQRQKIEVELRHAQKMEAIGQLAAGVAHEINTPIQFIGDSIHFVQDAYGDLLALIATYRRLSQAQSGGALLPELVAAEETADLTYLEAQIPRACERTREGVERVASIVAALKEFAHPEQKEQAPADLSHALQSTLIVARNEYKYVAEVEVALGELPAVVCQVADLSQVFLNLIVNAAHAVQEANAGTANKGQIRVATRVEGEDVVVAISDTGCGIPAAIRERVFEPFFTTKVVGRGTGQGLAIAHSIVVDRHRGSLCFDSEVGRGTTFHVRVPIAGRQSPGAQP